ncbi:DUF3168 domain-containing protein [Methylocystis sp. S23]
MIAPALALQSAMRAALINDPAMTALVPASNIYDRHARPEVFPCILMGEMQEVSDDLTLERNYFRLFPVFHVWTREPGLVAVKDIAWQLRKTLVGNPIVTLGLIDFRYSDSRFMRDPDGVTSHGVVSFEALVGEALE